MKQIAIFKQYLHRFKDSKKRVAILSLVMKTKEDNHGSKNTTTQLNIDNIN
jgi:putative component of toxin-antitoxin plasmid stabilization module